MMLSRQVVTVANCIVGVSVLAMPFCFKQCGVVLATTLLLLSGIMTRTVCYFLLKASTITRRRTYELLAYHTFGQAGKLVVEISIIGFLIGTLIAFLVVMGDLGPEIMADVFNVENSASLRTIIMTALSLFVALPLGLLRNIDSLSSVSTVTMLFYMILVAKVFSEGMGPLWSGSFLTRIHYWRPAGVLQCIPIFSMALSCQTQIFSIYDSLPEPSLQKMNEVIRKAVNVCTAFYISVGFLGYIAFCTQNFGGNILLSFGPTWSTQMIKVCFVLSIAFSFPLVIFPLRASLHSLIFRRVNAHHLVHDITTNYIPESRLKLLTVGIIGFTLFVGLMIPNIELVLGLVGSTTGSVICIIFPSVMFIRVTSKNTTERILAQAIFFIGVIIMVVTTYATLYAVEQAQVNEPVMMEQPLTEAGAKFVAKNPVLKEAELSREIEKLVPKLPPDLPVPVKSVEAIAVKGDDGSKVRNVPDNPSIERFHEGNEGHRLEQVPDKKELEGDKKNEENSQLEENKAAKIPDLKSDDLKKDYPPREKQEEPKQLAEIAREPVKVEADPALPQDRAKEPAIESNLGSILDVPKKQRKLALFKNANVSASRKANMSQNVPVKPAAEKMNQEDFLLQQLKEHEKEQKKLLQEQKEILAKLKQHQADDELKDQLRDTDKESKRNVPLKVNKEGESRNIENEVVKSPVVKENVMRVDSLPLQKERANVMEGRKDQDKEELKVLADDSAAKIVQVEEPRKLPELPLSENKVAGEVPAPQPIPMLNVERNKDEIPEGDSRPGNVGGADKQLASAVEKSLESQKQRPVSEKSESVSKKLSSADIPKRESSSLPSVPKDAKGSDVKPQNRDRDM